MAYKNKEDQRANAAKHYHGNKAVYKIRAKAFTKKNRELIGNFILDYKLTHPCVNCGETDPVVLEFNHLIRDDKYKNVANMREHSIEKVKEEIAKCEVLCANCHRRKTREENIILSRAEKIMRKRKESPLPLFDDIDTA